MPPPVQSAKLKIIIYGLKMSRYLIYISIEKGELEWWLISRGAASFQGGGGGE